MRRWAAFAGMGLIAATAGCGLRAAQQAGQARSRSAPENAKQIPRTVSSQGITVRWREKRADGVVQRLLEMDAEQGKLEARDQSGVLQKVTGVIFQDDKPRANFTAPVVEAAESTGTVIARGGVVITSIDPPGVKVTTKRLTWYARKDKIVCEGDVRADYWPTGAATRVAYMRAEHVTLDTKMERFSIP